jgi:hypothetical protein
MYGLCGEGTEVTARVWLRGCEKVPSSNCSSIHSIRYDASKDRLNVERCARKKLFPVDLYKRWKDGDLRKSDQETKGDGMPSPLTQVSDI